MTKQKILKILTEADGFVSGENIARILKISRAAVSKAINVLRREGVCIDSFMGKGYRLLMPDDLLDEERIKAHIKTQTLGKKLIILSEVESTNTYIKKLAGEGEISGTVVIADRQTGGRGRRTKTFQSPAGGIYMSVLIRPEKTVNEMQLFTISAAVAVVRAIKNVYGITIDIKWINDLFYKGKKLGGILTEVSLSAEAGTVDSVILGIGINTKNVLSNDLQKTTTSLSKISKEFRPRRELIAAILYELENIGENVIDEYKSYMFLLGEEVELTGVKSAAGKVIDIENDGSIIIETSDGQKHGFNTGEISIKAVRR